MEKILDLVDIIACEKGLEASVVSQVVKDILIKITKKYYNENLNYIIEDDEETRSFKIIHLVHICADDDERLKSDPDNFQSVSQAKEISTDVNIGDELYVDLTQKILGQMGRNAINVLFSDLEYHIQRAIENQTFARFKEMVGKIIIGQVVGIDDSENTFVEIEDVRAILPLKNRIKGEKFKVNDSVRAILKNVRFTKEGIHIELSRTTPKMLEALLEQEVPEIKDGEVVIFKSARIPGDRAKIAVYSTSPRVDPVGSSVGSKGVRINAVSKELCGESIDCIEYSEIPEIFITKAIAPAQIVSVKILTNTAEEKKALITLMSDQKSKAIGKNGVNIRLASMLTGFELELEEIDNQDSKDFKDSTAQQEKQPQKVGIDALQSLFKE